MRKKREPTNGEVDTEESEKWGEMGQQKEMGCSTKLPALQALEFRRIWHFPREM
jgi:hypothetical protein